MAHTDGAFELHQNGIERPLEIIAESGFRFENNNRLRHLRPDFKLQSLYLECRGRMHRQCQSLRSK